VSDEPDEPDDADDGDGGTLVQGPWSGESSYAPPPIPDFIDTIPRPEDIPAAPPESPEETTMELPRVPAAPDPATALRSEGIAPPEIEEEEEGYEESEYDQSRSLADRLGDWLEFRLERARSLHESEGPFREAEIARKTALLEARTAQETALMEQNGKFHAAVMKARSDRAAARGKADADRMRSPSSGLGADKGRSKAAAGGGSGAGPSRTNSGGPGGRSGSGTAGGGPSNRGGAKGPERGPGSRNTGTGPNGSSRGGKGPQETAGGLGRGGGSGPGGGAREQWARGRQERAGLRQAGRQERRNTGHAASVADRTQDRDQARAHRQAAWEDRRAKKAERDAARRAKRDGAPGRTTFGQAVAAEAQRRFDKRRAAATADKDAGPGKDGKADPYKVDLTKSKDRGKATDPTAAKGTKDAPGGASSTGKDTPTSETPGTAKKAADGPSDGAKKRRSRRRRTASGGRAKPRGRARRTGRTRGSRRERGRPWTNPFEQADDLPTVEWPDRPAPTPPPRNAGDDIIDAVIVDDGWGFGRRPASSPSAVTAGAPGLPPAPERHTARPGTSRPPRPRTEGSSVSSSQVAKPSGQGPLASQHRTDITFDDYLMVMANIAIQAASDQEKAEALAEALDKVADALRDMAADLIGDHNITTAVTDLIADLADSAARMKTQAERCGTECGLALEAAKLAAAMVARIYGQDMAAKEDAGLRYASAAAHHD
jgi:hypothetical protein